MSVHLEADIKAVLQQCLNYLIDTALKPKVKGMEIVIFPFLLIPTDKKNRE